MTTWPRVCPEDTFASRASQANEELPPLHETYVPVGRSTFLMYHCHILEHHAAGMMGHFEVVRPERGGTR